jgi:hypothetical protein
MSILNIYRAIENQIDHEKLMAICLGINDDINKTFQRYDNLKNKRKPAAFYSCFYTDYAEYNMNNVKKQSVTESLSTQTSIQQKNKNNQNLIDFDFSNDESNNVSNPSSQKNVQQTNQIQNIGQKKNIQNIDDLFDILNK